MSMYKYVCACISTNYLYSPRVRVVLVYFLFYLSMYLCFARCVICVLLRIHINICFEYIYIYIYIYIHVFTYSCTLFDVHLCHGACCSTHSLAYMPVLLFRLLPHSCTSFVVYLNSYTHISPSSRKFMFAAKSTSISPPSCIFVHSGKNIYFPAFIYTYPLLSLGMYLPILICRHLPILATLCTHSILIHTYSEAYV